MRYGLLCIPDESARQPQIQYRWKYVRKFELTHQDVHIFGFDVQDSMIYTKFDPI